MAGTSLLRRLGIEHPVIAAPMRGGPSTAAELVRAVVAELRAAQGA